MAKPKPKLVERVRPDWANRVYEVLKVQHRTQAGLAEVVGIDETQLSHIMGGDPRYAVSPELLQKISQYLGVPYAWLFGDPSTPVGGPQNEP